MPYKKSNQMKKTDKTQSNPRAKLEKIADMLGGYSGRAVDAMKKRNKQTGAIMNMASGKKGK